MTTCEVGKIDSNITGLRYAVEECIGQLPPVTPGTAASGVLTVSGQPTAGDAITVGTVTYDFVDASPTGYEILIGAAVTDTIANIAAAVNTGTPSVVATAGSGEVDFNAALTGTAGNSIATTTSVGASTLSFGAATLTGGADDVTTTVWKPLEPNSYSDFGGQVTTVARKPINPSRQQKKGVITDLDASGGFNQDLTSDNAEDILQAFMFADIRTKASYIVNAASGDLAVTKTGTFATITSTALDFMTLGLIPGESIFIGGSTAATQFAQGDNNGFKRVRSVASHALVLDKSSQPMVADPGTGKTITIILGRVLKNETGTLIKRRSLQLERTLGSLDGLDPPQAEYLVGAVASKWTLNAQSAQILNADYVFMATDIEQRTQLQGLKPGDRPDLAESDAFNSTSDLTRLKLAVVSSVDEAPKPLFGFATDMSIDIDNTLSTNKALGVLGAFDVSAGTFTVTGSMTAYFSDVTAVQAVRNNADVTLDVSFVKDGHGIVIDMPLIALGDGRLNVEIDKAIMLPLSSTAATGAKVNASLDHTLLFTFFDDLPDWASD